MQPPRWFKTIVMRRCVAIQRGQKILTVPLDYLPASPEESPQTAGELDRRQKQHIIKQELKALPKNEREAVQLFYLDGLTLKETGARQGTKAKTIQSRLHTARG